jgi:hypothetical protein
LVSNPLRTSNKLAWNGVETSPSNHQYVGEVGHLEMSIDYHIEDGQSYQWYSFKQNGCFNTLQIFEF